MPDQPAPRLPEPDRPWLMRTYAGHSDARRSNELYRRNLEKGQTGLSVAFDLPTQTGYDPDHELARGEVGKVGVSIAHKGDMRDAARRDPARPDEHLDDDQRDRRLAAGAVHRRRRGTGRRQQQLQGTTQNDILKEYLRRGTYAFPPGPSMRLIADTIAYTVEHLPKWNPINICSYHLQEAGATPVQEIAYAMSNAIAVLDAVRDRVDQNLMGSVFGRISFFVNAGVRFIEEHAKLRAMAAIWDQLGRERYGVEDEKLPPVPLRRAGQLARSDRGAAGEQRLPDRARGAGGDARAERPRAGDPAPRLERGARPAAPVGPAVVAAPAADPRLRDRPARVPRHLRRLEGDGGAGRRAGRRRPRRRCIGWPSSAARSRRSTT